MKITLTDAISYISAKNQILHFLSYVVVDTINGYDLNVTVLISEESTVQKLKFQKIGCINTTTIHLNLCANVALKFKIVKLCLCLNEYRWGLVVDSR